MEFAQDVLVGIEHANYQTKRRNLELLKVNVVADNGKFIINCLAGQVSGEVRKLPKVIAGVVN